MATAEQILVEVVVALEERQVLIPIYVPADAEAGEAVDMADIQERFPEIDLAASQLAIWGSPVERNHALKASDRVEILRPLKIDPRDARRELARDGQFMGSSGPEEG